MPNDHNWDHVLGWRVGKLVAKQVSGLTTSDGSIALSAKCDCGKVVKISASRFVVGNYRSCGCARGPGKRLTSANKTSRFKGVSFAANRTKQWKAQCLRPNGKRHIGYFDTEEEAAHAYDSVATLAYGDAALTNAHLGLFDEVDPPSDRRPFFLEKDL